MEGEGEEGDELAPGEDPLAFLRSQPQFAQMRQVLTYQLWLFAVMILIMHYFSCRSSNRTRLF